jgi:hypothetical protein
VNIADRHLQNLPAATFFSVVGCGAWASTVLSVFHSYTAAEPLKIRHSRAIVKSAWRAFRKVANRLSLITDTFFCPLFPLTLPANNCG